MIDLAHDLHVHSTFSDGRHDIETNVATAAERGLTAIGLVDHVRRDTDWLPGYAAAVARLASTTPLRVTCGVEAKILDTSGELDMPALPDGVDEVLVADHQVPLTDGCHHPAAVRQMIDDGLVTPAEVVGSLLEATARAAERHERVTIAHLLSVLPKAGLSDNDVPEQDVRALARRLADAGARVEVSERWRCPSVRVATILADSGVELVASTDSHRADTIGVYHYVAEVAASL